MSVVYTMAGILVTGFMATTPLNSSWNNWKTLFEQMRVMKHNIYYLKFKKMKSSWQKQISKKISEPSWWILNEGILEDGFT